MKPIIRVKGVSKKYRLGARRAVPTTLRDTLAGAMRTPSRPSGVETTVRRPTTRRCGPCGT